jgi:hypothetical protein
MSDDKKESIMVDGGKFGVVDDNVLHQFQRMFGSLSLSDR